MADIDVEVRALLERVDSLPVRHPPLERLRAAGRRRTRYRQAAQLAGVCVAIAGIVTGIVLVVPGDHAAPSPVSIPGAGPPPTSLQLGDGQWVAIPTAPIKTCFPIVEPDGSGVVVVEPGYHHDTDDCSPAAAVYNVTTNTWTKISAPPTSVGQDSVASWGGGRLITIAGQTRAVTVWTAKTDRWSTLPNVPAPATTRGSAGVTSVAWTSSGFAAVDVDNGVARVYTLNNSNRWVSIGEPAADPARVGPVAPVIAAAIGASNSVTYVAEQFHPGVDLDVALFALRSGRWNQVAGSLARVAGLPAYNSTDLRPLRDGLLVVGDNCPSCMEDTQEATFIPTHAGVAQAPIGLNLKTNLYVAGADLAAGADSVIAVYPRGIPMGAPSMRQHPATRIYSATHNTWINGPPPPAIGSDIGAYWTSRGVLYLGHATEDGYSGFTRTIGFLLTPRR
jgi:hypothetical protein